MKLVITQSNAPARVVVGFGGAFPQTVVGGGSNQVLSIAASTTAATTATLLTLPVLPSGLIGAQMAAGFVMALDQVSGACSVWQVLAIAVAGVGGVLAFPGDPTDGSQATNPVVTPVLADATLAGCAVGIALGGGGIQIEGTGLSGRQIAWGGVMTVAGSMQLPTIAGGVPVMSIGTITSTAASTTLAALPALAAGVIGAQIGDGFIVAQDMITGAVSVWQVLAAVVRGAGGTLSFPGNAGDGSQVTNPIITPVLADPSLAGCAVMAGLNAGGLEIDGVGIAGRQIRWTGMITIGATA